MSRAEGQEAILPNAHFISMHYGPTVCSTANCSRSALTGIPIKFVGNQIQKAPHSFYDPVGMQFQHYIFCLIQKDLESSPPLLLTANNRPLNIPHGRNSRRARFHAFVTIVPRARGAAGSRGPRPAVDGASP